MGRRIGRHPLRCLRGMMSGNDQPARCHRHWRRLEEAEEEGTPVLPERTRTPTPTESSTATVSSHATRRCVTSIFLHRPLQRGHHQRQDRHGQ